MGLIVQVPRVTQPKLIGSHPVGPTSPGSPGHDAAAIVLIVGRRLELLLVMQKVVVAVGAIVGDNGRDTM